MIHKKKLTLVVKKLGYALYYFTDDKRNKIYVLYKDDGNVYEWISKDEVDEFLLKQIRRKESCEEVARVNFLNSDQASKTIGCDKKTLRNWRWSRTNGLRFFSNPTMYLKEEIKDWLEEYGFRK